MSRIFFMGLLLVILSSCSDKKVSNDTNIAGLPWAQIEANAKGNVVTMMMFQGDKKVNRYMTEYVVPTVKELYGITLNLVPGQGKEIVSNMMSEKEAGKATGEIDLCWINGETFFQLRQIDALFGPYTSSLPNSRYVDYDNPIIKYDFQQPVNGFETPWGQSFFYMIYDSARLQKPPVTMADFEVYWKTHPGRFTLSNDFSGMTLLKTWLVEIAGGTTKLDGEFNQKLYDSASTVLWKWLNANKQYFWKEGQTFPASNTVIAQMFSNGELDFTVSFNDAEIDNKVGEGVYAPTSKAYILQAGAIHNTHYVGIASNSANKEAAMVICNFLISPDAQIRKSDSRLWGSRTVLAMDKLEPKWQQAFDTLPKKKYGLSNAQINTRSIKEPAPEYMLKVFEDFREKLINE